MNSSRTFKKQFHSSRWITSLLMVALLPTAGWTQTDAQNPKIVGSWEIVSTDQTKFSTRVKIIKYNDQTLLIENCNKDGCRRVGNGRIKIEDLKKRVERLGDAKSGADQLSSVGGLGGLFGGYVGGLGTAHAVQVTALLASDGTIATLTEVAIANAAVGATIGLGVGIIAAGAVIATANIIKANRFESMAIALRSIITIATTWRDGRTFGTNVPAVWFSDHYLMGIQGGQKLPALATISTAAVYLPPLAKSGEAAAKKPAGSTHHEQVPDRATAGGEESQATSG